MRFTHLLLCALMICSTAACEGDRITNPQTIVCADGRLVTDPSLCIAPPALIPVTVGLAADYFGSLTIQGTASASPADGVMDYAWSLFRGTLEIATVSGSSSTQLFDVSGQPDPCGAYVIKMFASAADGHTIVSQASDRGVTVPDSECASLRG